MGGYDHTQRGGWHWMIAPTGVLLIAFGMLSLTGPDWPTEANLALLGCGVLMLLASSGFAHLRVWDEGDRLAVRFGPIPLLGTEIPYAAMESVEPCRVSWLYGWGVHGFLWHSIAFNIWGFGGVRIRLKERRGLLRARTYFIGTDEPEALAAFLRQKIGESPPSALT